MDKRCINISHIAVQDLAKELNLKPVIVGAKIAIWQEKNNTYEIPSADDLRERKTPQKSKQKVYYQNNTGKLDKDYIASEKTIRDLSARMSDRIGIPVKFESDRTKDYKGKLENGVAYINLAYANLDTPIHEIAFHPIIAALKQKSETTIKNHIQDLIEKGVIIKEC